MSSISYLMVMLLNYVGHELYPSRILPADIGLKENSVLALYISSPLVTSTRTRDGTTCCQIVNQFELGFGQGWDFRGKLKMDATTVSISATVCSMPCNRRLINMISQSSNALCTAWKNHIFKDEDPTVEDCKRKFMYKFSLPPHRAQHRKFFYEFSLPPHRAQQSQHNLIPEARLQNV